MTVTGVKSSVTLAHVIVVPKFHEVYTLSIGEGSTLACRRACLKILYVLADRFCLVRRKTSPDSSVESGYSLRERKADAAACLQVAQCSVMLAARRMLQLV